MTRKGEQIGVGRGAPPLWCHSHSCRCNSRACIAQGGRRQRCCRPLWCHSLFWFIKILAVLSFIFHIYLPLPVIYILFVVIIVYCLRLWLHGRSWSDSLCHCLLECREHERGKNPLGHKKSDIPSMSSPMFAPPLTAKLSCMAAWSLSAWKRLTTPLMTFFICIRVFSLTAAALPCVPLLDHWRAPASA